MAAADDERDVSTTQYCAKLQEWMWSYYWGCAPPVPAVYYSLPDAFPWRPAQPSPAETPHWYSQVAFRAPSAAGPEPAPAGPGPRRVDGNAPQPGREYTIPSPLHRLLAETVDFFILFCVKATVVLWVMHLSGMKDISKFVMNFVVEEIDDNTSLEDLQKMMAVALVYRMLVCFYEHCLSVLSTSDHLHLGGGRSHAWEVPARPARGLLRHLCPGAAQSGSGRPGDQPPPCEP
ncbi:protein FAM8A1 isoform X5 [Denticeps clupeoides]|uniref:protein FAM8A1 isoform X5 n=1 Tax=Denticeps clupeoides TaxID=299321 RepID=UPI0010A2AB53|nr:protein FAM8A1-like isoform X5 [Denticeps clupeoides]